MTDTDIKSALFRFIESSSVTSEAKYGLPDHFDAEADDLEKFFWISLQTISEEATRRSDPKYKYIRVVVHCYSRATDNIYQDTVLSDEVGEALRHAVIAVTDSGEISGDVLGYMQLYEPTVTDETQKGSPWRQTNVVIPGKVEASPE